MKHTAASILGLACAASIISSSTAGAATVVAPPANYTYTESPAWSDAYVDSIGVDSQFADHNYAPLVKRNLEWSGIRHLRDSGPPTALLVATYADLGQHGIKHSIGMDRGFDPAVLKADLIAFAPYVDYVEQSNEADNYQPPNWAQMKTDQANVYSVLHSSPAFAGIVAMGPSFANPTNAQHVLPLDPVEDEAQLHNSTCDWNPGVTSPAGIPFNTAIIRATSSKPIVTTETGFNSDRTRGCSLPDAIIAKYLPRTSAERWLAGEPRTYFDFLANTTNVVFGGMGLMQIDGTPKPQFYAESGIIHLLADPGTPPAPQIVSYSVNGATPDVHHIMLARKDGSLDLMLWREIPCWDHWTRATIPAPALPITVTLPAGKSWVGLFQMDPVSFGYHRTQLPVGTGGMTATFPVTDSISVLHIYGRGASGAMIRH